MPVSRGLKLRGGTTPAARAFCGQRQLHDCKLRRNTKCSAAHVTKDRSPEEAELEAPKSHFVTGGRIGAAGEGRCLMQDRSLLPLASNKQIVLVRHGQTTWNLEGRIQGSSTEAQLTEQGKQQAAATREALTNIPFKACFTSPITRASQSAETIWEGRDGPLIQLDSLREAHLGYLQGMTNDYAKEHHAEVYGMWRQKPAEFEIEGKHPVPAVFEAAHDAWQEIIQHESDVTLVVTHKSVLRALTCVALGLGPTAFRAIDIHNSGVSIFWVNTEAEAMLQNLNLTMHLSMTVKY